MKQKLLFIFISICLLPQISYAQSTGNFKIAAEKFLNEGNFLEAIQMYDFLSESGEDLAYYESQKKKATELHDALQNYKEGSYEKALGVFNQYIDDKLGSIHYYIGRIYSISEIHKNLQKAKDNLLISKSFEFPLSDDEIEFIDEQFKLEKSNQALEDAQKKLNNANEELKSNLSESEKAIAEGERQKAIVEQKLALEEAKNLEAELNSKKLEIENNNLKRKLKQTEDANKILTEANEFKKMQLSDSDGDAVVLKFDECPDEKGQGTKNGCPKEKGLKVELVVGTTSHLHFAADANGNIGISNFHKDDTQLFSYYINTNPLGGVRLHWFDGTSPFGFFLDTRFLQNSFSTFNNIANQKTLNSKYEYLSIDVPIYFKIHTLPKNNRRKKNGYVYKGVRGVFAGGAYYNYNFNFTEENSGQTNKFVGQKPITEHVFGGNAATGIEFGKAKGFYMQILLVYKRNLTSFFNKNYSYLDTNLNTVQPYKDYQEAFQEFEINMSFRFW